MHPILATAVGCLAACGAPAPARAPLEALLASERRLAPEPGWDAFRWDERVRRDAARALARI